MVSWPAHSETGASGREKRHLIAPPRLPIVVLLSAAGLLAVIGLSLTPVSWQLPYSGYVQYMLILGVLLWAVGSMASMRVAVDSTTMVIINGISIVEFKRNDIADVTSHNGIIIETRSGYRCIVEAYGPSQLQGLRSSPRYARIADTIRGWAQSVEPGPNVGAIEPKARSSRRAVQRPPWRPRKMLTVGLPSCLLGAQLLGFILWTTSELIFALL